MTEQPRSHGGRRPLNDAIRQQIIDLYRAGEGEVPAAIARALSLSSTTITRHLKAAGVYVDPKTKPSRMAAIAAAYAGGFTANEVAAQFGIQPEAVYKNAQRLGVNRHKDREAAPRPAGSRTAQPCNCDALTRTDHWAGKHRSTCPVYVREQSARVRKDKKAKRTAAAEEAVEQMVDTGMLASMARKGETA